MSKQQLIKYSVVSAVLVVIVTLIGLAIKSAMDVDKDLTKMVNRPVVANSVSNSNSVGFEWTQERPNEPDDLAVYDCYETDGSWTGKVTAGDKQQNYWNAHAEYYANGALQTDTGTFKDLSSAERYVERRIREGANENSKN